MSDFTGIAAQTAYPARSRVIFMVTFLLWWALLALFNVFPSLDIAVAQSVFTQTPCSIWDGVGKTCGRFAYDSDSAFNVARSILFATPYLAAIILIGDVVRFRIAKRTAWTNRRMVLDLTALATLALGCGLTVNLFLKAFSGRPRPRETSWFGGSLDFVQAGSFAGKCLKNCSFVSGESSSAGWLFCLILLLPARLRIPIGLPLAVISFAVPAMRVMMGAHYLSDVILGWLSSVVIFAGLLAATEALTNRRYL